MCRTAISLFKFDIFISTAYHKTMTHFRNMVSSISIAIKLPHFILATFTLRQNLGKPNNSRNVWSVEIYEAKNLAEESDIYFGKAVARRQFFIICLYYQAWHVMFSTTAVRVMSVMSILFTVPTIHTINVLCTPVTSGPR